MIKLIIESIFFFVALPAFIIFCLILFWDGICWGIFCYKNKEKFIDSYGSWMFTARIWVGSYSDKDKERLLSYLKPEHYLFIEEYYGYYQNRKKKLRIINKLSIFIFISFSTFIFLRAMHIIKLFLPYPSQTNEQHK